MLTKQQAIDGQTFQHVRLKDSRGGALQCRASGKCQTWKTRPNDFKLPVKYGLYQSFYITHSNAHDWQPALNRLLPCSTHLSTITRPSRRSSDTRVARARK